jgi:hypothetical protein
MDTTVACCASDITPDLPLNLLATRAGLNETQQEATHLDETVQLW